MSIRPAYRDDRQACLSMRKQHWPDGAGEHADERDEHESTDGQRRLVDGE